MGNEELNELPEELMEYFCEQVLKRDWPNSIPVSTSKFYVLKNDIMKFYTLSPDQLKDG